MDEEIRKEFDRLAGPRRERELPWLAAFDLAIAAAILFAWSRGLVPFSPVPFLFALGWVSLWLRGLTWGDVGFALPADLRRPLAIGVVLGVVMELVSTFVAAPLASPLTGPPPELAEFRPLVGNLELLLLMIGPMWLLAAFGEELVYRGFLLSRIAGGLGSTRAVWAIGVVLVGLLAGWAQSGGGWTGVLLEALAGVVLGAAYLAFGRNLTVPIVAHGTANTLAFVLIYFGRYPGL